MLGNDTICNIDMMKKALLTFALASLVALTAWAGKPKAFFFVQLTDMQMGFKEPEGEVSRSVGLLNDAVDAINRLHPAFVVVTGDMINTWYDQKQYDAYRECMDRIDSSIPVYTIPGNHDMKPVKNPESVEAYASHFGPDHFAFSYGGSFFIGYNSNWIMEKMTDREEEQFQWLDKQLRKHRRSKHRFMFTHCSIIKESPDEKEGYFNYREPYRSKYLQLCKDRKVDAVFSGHFHRTRTALLDGTRHVTCTATGHPLGDGISAINIVTVYPDSFTYEIVPAKEAVNPLGK